MEPTKQKFDVKAEVVELKNDCPVFKPGDFIYMRSTEQGAWVIDTDKSSTHTICMWCIPPMCSEVVKVRHGIEDELYVHCIDPGKPYTGYGVVFRILRV
ncbi:MAG: hypothetical protein AB1765_07190 [Candidatus Hydrogenedentota bacterium]